MAGYMVLGKFRQGPGDMSRITDEIRELKAGIEKMGARVVGLWGLMGRFDMLMIVDAPDELTAVGVAQLAGRAMNASTETVRAFSEEDLASLAQRMSG